MVTAAGLTAMPNFSRAFQLPLSCDFCHSLNPKDGQIPRLNDDGPATCAVGNSHEFALVWCIGDHGVPSPVLVLGSLDFFGLFFNFFLN